ASSSPYLSQVNWRKPRSETNKAPQILTPHANTREISGAFCASYLAMPRLSSGAESEVPRRSKFQVEPSMEAMAIDQLIGRKTVVRSFYSLFDSNHRL
ncbi:hypothetical protein THAOC_33678, partial [Thalassiosira oceanica]